MKGVTNILTGAAVSSVLCADESAVAFVLNNYTLPARWTVLAQGAKFIIVGDDQGGEFVTPEYQAVLTYATGQAFTLPSAANQSAQCLNGGVIERGYIFSVGRIL